MQVGGQSERVEVRASSPIVDVTSTTVGSTLDTATLAQLPVPRRLSDALYLAPGVSSSGRVGRANPSLSGASGLDNQFIVDGVNLTNAGYGGFGSFSGVFGSLGNGVTFDFIKEIQIKTAGYEAEFGQATGGVVNVVTRSGTNTVRGTLFGYVQPATLEGAYPQVETLNGSINTVGTSATSGGIEAGGPLSRDRLFLFGALDPQQEHTRSIAPPGFPLRDMGGVTRTRRIFPYAAKLTWQQTSAHRVEMSAFGDPARGDNGPQRPYALLASDTASFSRLKKYGGDNQTIRYDGMIGAHWLVEGSFARAHNSVAEVPSVDQWLVYDLTSVPNTLSGGIGFYEIGNDGTNLQYQVKSTHLAGAHQLRYGVQLEAITYDNAVNYTGPAFTLPNGQRTLTGAFVDVLPDPVFGRIYRATALARPGLHHTRQRYFDFFV